MKLRRESISDINLITAYEAASISVNQAPYTGNLLVAPDAVQEPWFVGGFGALSAVELAMILSMKPSVVLLGTGAQQCFPTPNVLRPLIEAGIGFEVMDTRAACRTYNILASEGRQVVAGLILGSPT